jgi:hypothetical protein
MHSQGTPDGTGDAAGSLVDQQVEDARLPTETRVGFQGNGQSPS